MLRYAMPYISGNHIFVHLISNKINYISILHGVSIRHDITDTTLQPTNQRSYYNSQHFEMFHALQV